MRVERIEARNKTQSNEERSEHDAQERERTRDDRACRERPHGAVEHWGERDAKDREESGEHRDVE